MSLSLALFLAAIDATAAAAGMLWRKGSKEKERRRNWMRKWQRDGDWEGERERASIRRFHRLLRLFSLYLRAGAPSDREGERDPLALFSTFLALIYYSVQSCYSRAHLLSRSLSLALDSETRDRSYRARALFFRLLPRRLLPATGLDANDEPRRKIFPRRTDARN